jgi:hypothetical protein
VREYERVRDAVIRELTPEAAGMRLGEIHRRVEERVGEPVPYRRFQNYVNFQSKAANPMLERLSRGMYRLRA